jgi:AmmeMemoRadiSam system protein A
VTRVYDDSDRTTLLDVARGSIEYGLRQGSALPVDVESYTPRLREERACFVTLKDKGDLRGCIGTMEATRPLVKEVSERAWCAGFADPRFDPLQPDEQSGLSIEISILSALEQFDVRDEADLLAQLRPGVDGLLLVEGSARATFLPAVWESLPDACEFVRELKRKARLAKDHWSDAMTCYRFTTESIE